MTQMRHARAGWIGVHTAPRRGGLRPPTGINRMASAFEHDDLKRALAL